MAQSVDDVIIIGSGSGGLAAAIYAGRFRLKARIITGHVGGTVTEAATIANYPSLPEIDGPELAERLRDHARSSGVEMDESMVDNIRHDAGCFVVETRDTSSRARTLIFATGSTWKRLGVLGEEKYARKGVHSCALCDAPFYKDKVVVVAGGSDSAAKEALFLAEYAKKVYVITENDRMLAEPINNEHLLEDERVEIIYKNRISAIDGESFVTAVTLESPYEGSQTLSCDGLFVAIGRLPNSALAKSLGVSCNAKDEIITGKDTSTDVPGVYAVGDVTDTPFKQAITAAGEGSRAAYEVYHYLEKHDIICYCDDNERCD